MSADKSNQLVIREAIRKIALGRSMERVNMAPGGMSGVGTARVKSDAILLVRHIFVMTVTLTNGVPIESVSKMLGHRSLKTTQIYAKIVNDKLSEDMTRLSDRLIHLKM